MYQGGLGTEKSDTDAFKWFKQAALQGDASAQINLGLMYQNGEGVGKNVDKAFTWYKSAAT